MLPTDSSREVISSVLGREERLLWSGQPRQGMFLRSTNAYLVPVSLLWTGFAFFWEGSVVNSHAPVFFRLWGVPFVLMGLYVMVGRFFADAKLRSKTFYGVTSERIVIVSGLFSRTTKSLPLRTLSDVALTESNRGMGTITFGPVPPWWIGTSGWTGPSRHSSPSFDTIESAREVYEKIRLAQKQA